MAYPQGINFRATLAYVTDGASEAFEMVTGTTPNYPHTTSQGNNVGWEGALGDGCRNRSAGVDVRLAGMNFCDNGVTFDYRLDLSASGNWDINLAAGDATYAQGPIKVEVFDTATSRGVLCNASTSTGARWLDAHGTEFTEANWVASNVSQSVAFTTTIARIRIGGGAGGSSTIAHVKLTSGAAGYDAATFQAMLAQTQGGAAMIGRACRGVYG